MRRLFAVLLTCALGALHLAAQVPQATDLPGKPFFIKKTWTVGGEGDWDYLTFDPSALQLFIAHGHAVQVINVNDGTPVGTVTGLRDAHAIALDEQGQFGYISDGTANEVKSFDRSSLQVVATTPVCKNPRSAVYEPASQLVFAVCPSAAQESRIPRATVSGQRVFDPLVVSTVTVIDATSHARLADILIPGKLGFALADGKGTVFINVTDRNQIVALNTGDFASHLRTIIGASKANSQSILALDWSLHDQSHQPIQSPLHMLRLGTACNSPRGLALDGDHLRLFAACANQRMEVLNTGTGDIVATLPIGPGTDAIGYDPTRGLIYTANGGGLGSVTIIRQSVTDSYAVIQELPTRQRARTLAVNPASGEVYLVTNLEGFDLNQKGTGGTTHSLPVVHATPVAGSFQVLVLGN